MRNHALVLLASVLLAGPLLGQERPKGLEIPRERTARVSASTASVSPGQRAFFSLTGALVPPGSRELKLEVRIDGRLVLEDVIKLPFDSAGGVAELLAGDPAGLAGLLARAEKARKAQFSVSLDGRILATFTPAEFRAYNQKFQDSPPAVLKPAGEVRTFAADGEAAPLFGKPQGRFTKDYDPQCLAGCDAQHDYCYETEPSCAQVFECDICESQYIDCYQSCYYCTDPKSTSQYTTSSLYSTTFWGWQCLEDIYYPWEASWYISYSYVIRYYRWQRTEYCNGSHTDTLLYTWDTSDSCYSPTYLSCEISFGIAFPPYCPF